MKNIGKNIGVIMMQMQTLSLNPTPKDRSGSSSTTPPTPMLSTGNDANLASAINNMANAMTNGLQTVDRGSLKNVIANPTDCTIDITSNAGGSTITANLFNEDYLNTTPTDNGSGAGSVVTTYSDGFNGNLLSNIASTKGNFGLRIKQLQVSAIQISTGLQNKTAASGSKPVLRTFNGDSSVSDQNIPLSSTGNPQYNQSGFLVINIESTLKRYEQLLLTIKSGYQYQVIPVFDTNNQ